AGGPRFPALRRTDAPAARARGGDRGARGAGREPPLRRRTGRPADARAEVRPLGHGEGGSVRPRGGPARAARPRRRPAGARPAPRVARAGRARSGRTVAGGVGRTKPGEQLIRAPCSGLCPVVRRRRCFGRAAGGAHGARGWGVGGASGNTLISRSSCSALLRTPAYLRALKPAPEPHCIHDALRVLCAFGWRSAPKTSDGAMKNGLVLPPFVGVRG